MSETACILLFAAGHLVRDGWPPLGSTHAARALGAILCGLGSWLVLPATMAGAVGLLVLAGFYLDKRHGEGQNAKTPADMDMLLLSGLTSVSPVVLVAPVAVIAGWLKPQIWRLAWKLIPVDTAKPARWLTPTRAAAVIFGALFGAAVAGAMTYQGLSTP